MDGGYLMKETKRKKARREESLKRNKRKKIVLAAGCAAAAVVIIALLVFNVRQQGNSQHSEARIFTDGRQTVTLYGNGTFAAQLLHNNNKDGTYRETREGNGTTVIFLHEGTTVNARLVNNAFMIPDAWDDSHGHNKILRLKSTP